MHTYVILRGIKDKLHRWIEDMEKMFLPIRMNNQEAIVQLAMRPVYLYEIVYPNEAHDEVMRRIQPNEGFDYTNSPIPSEELKKTKKVAKRSNTVVNWLRKFMKLDPVKIPEGITPNTNWSIYRQYIGVHPIGSKPDIHQEFKNERL